MVPVVAETWAGIDIQIPAQSLPEQGRRSHGAVPVAHGFFSAMLLQLPACRIDPDQCHLAAVR
jgi:hypothetical protein